MGLFHCLLDASDDRATVLHLVGAGVDLAGTDVLRDSGPDGVTHLLGGDAVQPNLATVVINMVAVNLQDTSDNFLFFSETNVHGSECFNA